MCASGLSFVKPLFLSMSSCISLLKEQPSTGPDISSITMQLYNLDTSRHTVNYSIELSCTETLLSSTVSQISVISADVFHPVPGASVHHVKGRNMCTSVLFHGIPGEHPIIKKISYETCLTALTCKKNIDNLIDQCDFIRFGISTKQDLPCKTSESLHMMI